MTMRDEDRVELISLVREWLDDQAARSALIDHSPARMRRARATLRNAIAAAHVGRPDGLIVTMDNQHLFRQYRNYVSGEAQDLIDEAMKGV